MPVSEIQWAKRTTFKPVPGTNHARHFIGYGKFCCC